MTQPTAQQFRATRQNMRFADFQSFGNIWFVDSAAAGAGAATGYGYTREAPFSTLAYAFSSALPVAGDVILVAPSHAESLSGPAAIAANIAGVRVVGLGWGNYRPTFTWHTTDATIAVSVANVSFENIRCVVDVDEVVSMWNVTGSGVTFDTVDFIETAALQALQFLLTTAAADQITVKNCYHRQLTAAASAQVWLALVGVDDARIVNNTFLFTAFASTSSILISCSTALVGGEITGNRILWLGATITKIISSATGAVCIVCDNRMSSGTSVATAAAITMDTAYMHNNFWSDTAQVSGLLAPVVDTDT